MKSDSDLQRRYEDKPLLRLLDAYVLWAIGVLPQEQEDEIQQMTPTLWKAWNCEGNRWHEVIATRMDFPATMPTMVREMWQKNQRIAAANNVTITADDFAYMFVDANLAG